MREFVRRDNGNRNEDVLRAVVACPTEWDFGDGTVIARTPQVTLQWRRGDSVSVLLAYERIGYMGPGGRDTLAYTPAPGIDSIRIPVLRTKAGWRIGHVDWVKHWTPAAVQRWESTSTPGWFRDTIRAHLRVEHDRGPKHRAPAI